MLGVWPTRFEDPRTPLALVLAAAVAALVTAFAGQYLFGLEPCILCLYERVPWAAAAGIAVLGLAGRRRRWRLAALGVCGVVFAAGAALAFYHVGVEAHWWASAAGCEGGAVGTFSIDDLSPQALAQPLKPCDRVDFRLFGLSLAGWNVLLSAVAAAFCAASLHFLLRRTSVS